MKIQEKTFTLKNGRAKAFPYLLYSPDRMKQGEKYPMILVLHGAGERGEGPCEPLKMFPLLHMMEDGLQIPAIVAAPQCPCNWLWTDLCVELKEFADKIVATMPVDKDRIVCTGLSMGGFGTWLMGITYPDFFAGLAPICGGGTSWAVSQIKNVPVWAFHGDADSVVPVGNSIEMCDRLAAAGGNVKLTLFHGVDHDAWTPAFHDTKLIEWLLAQRKG
ncbi:MAG: dienelactone hydrolase family protein [Clostridia bacterium]|nr:dienelactone hydrolase family protein [Clostridia bacterium]